MRALTLLEQRREQARHLRGATRERAHVSVATASVGSAEAVSPGRRDRNEPADD